jgi:hypothetical protein
MSEEQKRCSFRASRGLCTLQDRHDGPHEMVEVDDYTVKTTRSDGAVTWAPRERATLRCDGDHPVPRCADPQCHHRDPRAGETKAPHIVVLCGSTRFHDHYERVNFEETLKGHIVLSVGFFPGAAARSGTDWVANRKRHGEDVGITPSEKLALDELHKRKIDLADEVIVINPGGYIGSSTATEIAYAEEHGKPIRYLEGPFDLCRCCHYPLGELETTRVQEDGDGTVSVWHLTCAEAEGQPQSEQQ